METWRRAGSKFVQMPQRSHWELDEGRDDRDNGWRSGSKDRQGGKSPGPSNVCQQWNGSGRWQRKGRRGANKDGTTSVTSVMSWRLVVDRNIKGKKVGEGGRWNWWRGRWGGNEDGESGESRKWGQLSDLGEDVRSGTQSNIKWEKRPENWDTNWCFLAKVK